MDSSGVGQKIIAIGTQASGGIGRKDSNTGNTICLNHGRVAISSPSVPPIASATAKPTSTRWKDSDQLFQ